MAFALLTGLGIWQLERRVWKLDLIRRVDQRVHAAPVPAPGPVDWPKITADHDEYRRVQVSGMFRSDKSVLVQAVTKLGPGYWVMTPLQAGAGFTVLINRGFIPAEPGPPLGPIGPVTVTGLLRISEPHGGFLRANDPAADRWFSRDVAAIAATKNLVSVAPYFIDADASPTLGDGPVGGLTVIRFPNSHLLYAFTWFGLAVMVVVGAVLLVRDERRTHLRWGARSGPPA